MSFSCHFHWESLKSLIPHTFAHSSTSCSEAHTSRILKTAQFIVSMDPSQCSHSHLTHSDIWSHLSCTDHNKYPDPPGMGLKMISASHPSSSTLLISTQHIGGPRLPPFLLLPLYCLLLCLLSLLLLLVLSAHPWPVVTGTVSAIVPQLQ